MKRKGNVRRELEGKNGKIREASERIKKSKCKGKKRKD